MASFERSNKSKIINSSLCLAILVAGLIYISILIWHSSQLSGIVASSTIEKGSFGPLSLFELSKQPVMSGGYQATIRFFSSGSIGYICLWTLVGILLAYARLKSFKKP